MNKLLDVIDSIERENTEPASVYYNQNFLDIAKDIALRFSKLLDNFAGLSPIADSIELYFIKDNKTLRIDIGRNISINVVSGNDSYIQLINTLPYESQMLVIKNNLRWLNG